MKDILWVAALLIAGACASSRTAPQPAPDGEDDGVELPEAEPSPFESEQAIGLVAPSCEPPGSSREIALSDQLENGLSPEDILAWVEGQHETAIHWLEPEGTTVGPETGEHQLFITVERASERARSFTPETQAIGHGTRCEDWLELDVKLALQSDGGALNEAIEGTLYTSDPRVAYFRASAGDDAFGGALAVQSSLVGALLSRVALELVLSPQGASGALFGVWRMPAQDEYEHPEQIASIGPVRCASGELAIGPGDVIPLEADGSGPSSKELLAQVDELPALPLTWRDSARTTATLRFTPDGEGACVAISATSPDDFALVAIDGQVALESADGRVTGSWPAKLEQYGTGGRLQVRLDNSRMTDGMTATPPELGFPGLERGDLTAISVDLSLTLDGASAAGALRLGGFHCGSGSLDSFCEYTSVELESATIGP